jgi:hypothetical protein
MQTHQTADQAAGKTLESIFQVGGKRVCKRPEGWEAVIRQFNHSHHLWDACIAMGPAKSTLIVQLALEPGKNDAHTSSVHQHRYPTLCVKT